MFKINDEPVTKKLEKIRQQVGGEKRRFTPQGFSDEINLEVNKKELDALFHGSGLLIKNGKPVFVYIKDHDNVHVKFDDAWTHNRVHFTVCEKMEEMEERGRKKRYHVTSRDNNKYTVEYANGVTKDVLLYPCQYCLRELGYLSFQNAETKAEKKRIVKAFDAKEAKNLANIHFHVYKIAEKEFQGEHVPVGYSASTHEITSAMYRKSKNYTCEECGVNLSKCPHLTDMHHVNGVKNDNVDDNLLCLCKLCHADMPMHASYNVDPKDASVIEAARRKQGIYV